MLSGGPGRTRMRRAAAGRGCVVRVGDNLPPRRAAKDAAFDGLFVTFRCRGGWGGVRGQSRRHRPQPGALGHRERALHRSCGRDLWRRPDMVWGQLAMPERELGVLGDVEGQDVLELACGTAYFSSWLARAGARPVALDFSGEQLATARRLQGLLGSTFPLIHGDAERVPLVSPALRPRGERARRRRVVRPGALVARGRTAPAAREGAWCS